MYVTLCSLSVSTVLTISQIPWLTSLPSLTA